MNKTTRLKMLAACGLLLSCGPALWTQGWDSGPKLLGPTGPVIGEPYTAATESRVSQTLADGTHVDRKISSTRDYRDSEGRTRSDRYEPPNRMTGEDRQIVATVRIFDPVTRAVYTLVPRGHTGIELLLPPPPAPRKKNDLSQPAPPKPGGITFAYEDLGTQVMEGLAVEGQRETDTIPTGREGNDGPIVVVTDRWFSKEMQLYVLTKKSDPRSGESINRTTNIERTEPDPSLFEVPSDYAIKMQQPQPMGAYHEGTVFPLK